MSSSTKEPLRILNNRTRITNTEDVVKGIPHKKSKKNKNSNQSSHDLSILDYYFKNNKYPPEGHCIINSIVDKSANKLNNGIVIQDWKEYTRRKEAALPFKYKIINARLYRNAQNEDEFLPAEVAFPMITPEIRPHIHIWKRKAWVAIQIGNLNHNLMDLIESILPKRSKGVLGEIKNVDTLLGAVCRMIEDMYPHNDEVAPYQGDFLYIRDYYNAVRWRIVRQRPYRISDREIKKWIYRDFIDGLCHETHLRYSDIVHEKSTSAYVCALECRENVIIQEMNDYYQNPLTHPDAQVILDIYDTIDISNSPDYYNERRGTLYSEMMQNEKKRGSKSMDSLDKKKEKVPQDTPINRNCPNCRPPTVVHKIYMILGGEDVRFELSPISDFNTLPIELVKYLELPVYEEKKSKYNDNEESDSDTPLLIVKAKVWVFELQQMQKIKFYVKPGDPMLGGLWMEENNVKLPM
ncbi:hypothetical protein NEPAR06_0823 [Nematocida parisii]|uniref:uncharacterized protein n=1 Tax=Nematocida parisii (strain ERTm1 / ATCC PRA-289) TaxID=881290 RepID=UPI000264BAF6|nr:uncharacterized protein NEPG_02272 [Nematocida parisii ERTm1]EIJ92873.1 hypothetical protein NEPG_02272 [Nematocida parisii ERTm1]KAI5143965.1 hypothetical protein NEPAR07_0962 [Nematocida parisii]KAI5154041.1 hypothetical protein NEPAR06_0823 [Nematocida parisii]KAI5156850.1 hypothetical protein NEPAR05_0846 [Nematocida parisii]|eukprot:XP_013060099.1 hypothetical protein NEPG_02272 [Nematocida parisii ERTm1]